MTQAPLVAINRADAQELQSLPRIGPQIANRIIKRRETGSWLGGRSDLISVGLTEADADALIALIDFTAPREEVASTEIPSQGPASHLGASAARKPAWFRPLIIVTSIAGIIVACAIVAIKAGKAVGNGNLAWFIGAPLAAALIGLIAWLHYRLAMIRAKAGVNKVVFTTASMIAAAIVFAGIGGGWQSLRFNDEFPWVSLAEADSDLIHLGLMTLLVGMAYLLAAGIEQAGLRFLAFLFVLGMAAWIGTPSANQSSKRSLEFVVLTASPQRAIVGAQVLVTWNAPRAETVEVDTAGKWTGAKGQELMEVPADGQLIFHARNQTEEARMTLKLEVVSQDRAAKIAGTWLTQAVPFERVALVSLRGKLKSEVSVAGGVLEADTGNWFPGIKSSSCMLPPTQGAVEVPIVFTCDATPPANVVFPMPVRDASTACVGFRRCMTWAVRRSTPGWLPSLRQLSAEATTMRKPKPAELLARLQAWVADPRMKNLNLDRRIQKIEENLGIPANIAHIFISMAAIGIWHSACGQARLVDGDAGGMEQLKLGVGYKRSAMLMQYRNWELLTVPTKRLTITPFQSSHVVSCCLATGDPHADRIKSMFLDGMPADYFDLPMLTYPRYVRALLWIERGDRFEITDDEYGAYAPLLAAWNDGDALADAVVQALDWHVRRTKPDNRDDLGDFEDMMVFAYPAEVLAALRLRERLGPPRPPVAHPLLDCGFGAPPPADEPWPKDDLLRKCEDQMRKMG